MKKHSFTRLYFKESEHREGGKCWIAKLKYDPETGERMENGTLIVLANTSGKLATNIDKEGRWDVVCIPMKSGKGFIVVESSWTEDDIELEIEDYRVSLVINDKIEKLKTEDGKFIPLYFDRKRWYDPKKILPSIRRKMEHLQLPSDFSVDILCKEFLEACDEVSEEYARDMKKASGDEVVDSGKLEKLAEKWGK